MFSKKNTTILKKNRILIKPKYINIQFPFLTNKCVIHPGSIVRGLDVKLKQSSIPWKKIAQKLIK